jgi:hypothetical protein
MNKNAFTYILDSAGTAVDKARDTMEYATVDGG